MEKSVYNISKMDCPSEEQMIRMKLESFNPLKQLQFDIPNRKLTVYHNGSSEQLSHLLDELNLGAKLISNERTNDRLIASDNSKKERKMLWAVLVINFTFFVLEMLYGWLSSSMGLIADSLDMLADSFVYILSLMAVGNSIIRKKQVAKLSGYFQMLLAFIGLIEVIRRFLTSVETPIFQNMIIISLLALMANSASLYLIQKAKSNEAHMQASAIFTSNDIIINIGVIVAGILVYYFQNKIPDLIIGSIVFIIVFQGAIRILKLAK